MIKTCGAQTFFRLGSDLPQRARGPVFLLAALWALIPACAAQDAGSNAGVSNAGQSANTGSGGNAAGGDSGSGQSGGAGGGTGETPRYPLIIGDDACPAAAPQVGACNIEASCVYSGMRSPIPAGLLEILSPMACTCFHGTWSCVSSDEKGDIACPLEDPLLAGPHVAGPCPQKAALPCYYARFENPPVALTSCFDCQETIDAQGDAGGDGGVVTSWMCGL